MSAPRDPGNGLAQLSPEMIERYERALRHPHAGVVKFMEKAYATAASGDNAGLPEVDRIRVYLSVYNTVQELTKGSADAAQAATDRLWGNLSAQAKRDMAANPGAAAAIVSDAMRSDPVLAVKLPIDTAALAPPEKPAFFDGLGRDPFDRMIAGNRVAGVYSGNSTANYSSLNGATYDPAKGIGTLTTQNFATSPFVGSGFSAGDISFIKQLHSEGYSTTNIVNAGKDARVLGFSAKDHKMVKDLATVDRYDPDARGFVRKTLDLKHSLEGDEKYKRLAAELAAAKTPAEIKAASDAIARHEAETIEATGVGAHIRGMKNKKAREAGEGVTVEVVKARRRAALKAAKDAKIEPALADAVSRGNAEAIRRVGLAREAAAHDPKQVKAFAALQQVIKQNAKLRVQATDQNVTVADQNAVVADQNAVVADQNTVLADKNIEKKVAVAAVNAGIDNFYADMIEDAGSADKLVKTGETKPKPDDSPKPKEAVGLEGKKGETLVNDGAKKATAKLRLAGSPGPSSIG